MNKIIISDRPGRDISGTLRDFTLKLSRGNISWKNLNEFVEHVLEKSFQVKKNFKQELLQKFFELWLENPAVICPKVSLFLIGQDYKNLKLCRLQMIRDFYKEVLGMKIAFEERYLSQIIDANFMLMHSYFSYSFLEIVEDDDTDPGAWFRYRGLRYDDHIDKGFSVAVRCGSEHSLHKGEFIALNARSTNISYIFTYDSKEIDYYIKDERDEYFKQVEHFYYPSLRTDFDESQRNSFNQGITHDEACLMMMFEWWKHGRYFTPLHDKQKRIHIPCYGSICRDGCDDKKPIPILCFSQQSMELTKSSLNHKLQVYSNARIYEVKQHIELW
jgi:hypothetical protein